MQLGCGLAVKIIRGHPYLYFWSYESRSWGSRRIWTYLGRVGRPRTRARATDMLLAYHVAARREMDRRIQRLQKTFVGLG